MAKMSLKELCRELNSPYASYRENASYKTAYSHQMPDNCHLIPNQAVSNSLSELIALELLEIKHGSELVQVAHLGGTETRMAYIGKTEEMKRTIKALDLQPFRVFVFSEGEFAFKYFARELARIDFKNAHFEYDVGTGTATRVVFILKRLVAVYEAQDNLVQVLRNISEKKDREKN